MKCWVTPKVVKLEADMMTTKEEVETGYGRVWAHPGDWLVTQPDGKKVLVTAAQFEAQYKMTSTRAPKAPKAPPEPPVPPTAPAAPAAAAHQHDREQAEALKRS